MEGGLPRRFPVLGREYGRRAGLLPLLLRLVGFCTGVEHAGGTGTEPGNSGRSVATPGGRAPGCMGICNGVYKTEERKCETLKTVYIHVIDYM